MVKHIILWTLKEMSDSEKESVKAGIRRSQGTLTLKAAVLRVCTAPSIKEGLEGLKGKIPGLVDIKVNTNGF